MRFLVLFALVAAVAADYHDDTFHFSTNAKSGGSLLRAQAQPAQPAYRQQYAAVRQVAAPASILLHQQVHHVPVHVAHIAQPVQYAVHHVAHPEIHHIAHVAHPEIHHIAHVAQPEIHHIAHVAQPEIHHIAHVAQPEIHHITHVAQPEIHHIAHVAQPQIHHIAHETSYAAGYNAPKWRILSQTQEVDPAGPYKLSYATENGIQVQEEGALVNSAEGPAVAAQGSYSFTAPDGAAYTVNYVADENGFRAAGDHLPTPPPIPAEILKSLEENARSGEQYDDQGRLLRQ